MPSSEMECPECGGRDVTTPPQTLDMPMIKRCLDCGFSGATQNFRSTTKDAEPDGGSD